MVNNKVSVEARTKKMMRAKKMALVNVPKAIRDLYLKEVGGPKDKRSSNEILREVRYGIGGA